jgi:Ran GTPase-activating protein (RanGAP) involved in mRNA processing and transport
MNEGAGQLFKVLKTHPTLTALTIANHDRMHRNRIGQFACDDLLDLLSTNKILSYLNIADNRIGNEGLRKITPGLTPKSPLVVLNLSNNDLDGLQTIECLFEYLHSARNLLELNLSSNRIGD